MAVLFKALPFVRYTLNQPAAERPVPSIRATAACCCSTFRMESPVACIVPVARPRITLIADWFPAFPPAPTSIVRKNVTTKWSLIKSWYESRIKLDEDCNTSNPTSHRPRLKASSIVDFWRGTMLSFISGKSHNSRSGSPSSQRLASLTAQSRTPAGRSPFSGSKQKNEHWRKVKREVAQTRNFKNNSSLNLSWRPFRNTSSLPFSKAFVCESLRWCVVMNLPPRPRSGVLLRSGDLETGAILATKQSGSPPVFTWGNEYAVSIEYLGKKMGDWCVEGAHF